jgi:hypothetical protein
VLGLAPKPDGNTLIKSLKDSGQIDDEIVSFNYENPLDID